MDINKLRKVSDAVLDHLRAASFDELGRILLAMRDYHGFMKCRLPEDLFETAREQLGLEPKNLQVELVSVNQDLRDELREHKEATAFVTILGNQEKLPEPVLASGYIDGSWQTVAAGQQIEIPAGTPHGFTVEVGGTLFFLSVQSPPIEREDGHDDYYKVGE